MMGAADCYFYDATGNGIADFIRCGDGTVWEVDEYGNPTGAMVVEGERDHHDPWTSSRPAYDIEYFAGRGRTPFQQDYYEQGDPDEAEVEEERPERTECWKEGKWPCRGVACVPGEYCPRLCLPAMCEATCVSEVNNGYARYHPKKLIPGTTKRSAWSGWCKNGRCVCYKSRHPNADPKNLPFSAEGPAACGKDWEDIDCDEARMHSLRSWFE